MLSPLSFAIVIAAASDGAVVTLIIFAILVVVVIIRIINNIGPRYPTLSFVISDIIALHTNLISSHPIKRVIFQLIKSIVVSGPRSQGTRAPQTRTNA